MAASSSGQSRYRRWLRHNRIFVMLGAVIVVLILVAGILPQFIITSLKQLPDEAHFEFATEPSRSLALDARSYQEQTVPAVNRSREECAGEAPAFACFLVEQDAQLTRTTTSEPTDNRKEILIESSTSLAVGDQRLIDIEDRVRLTRNSAFPVPEPASALQISVPPAGLNIDTGGFSRTGLQYFFPFNTERVSYDFFDPLAQVPAPLDFVNRVEHEGMRSFHFHQDLAAVDLMSSMAHAYTQPQGISDVPELNPLLRPDEMSKEERQAIASLRVGGPAGNFYDAAELGARGFSAEERVSLSPFYSVNRDIWVEPSSGVSIDHQEEVYLYLAADASEAQEMADAWQEEGTPNPNRTLLATSLAWDEKTQTDAQTEAQTNKSVLKLLEVTSLAANTIIVILVTIGLLIFLRRRFRASQELEA
ncbi:porin PorA family protein [Corynebacterium sp. A21]|uniref:porin PorA family protein n=1 Tax=Corynebacterium sp. A21 TaxID=3457318 RepID=UPI003FD4CA45